VVELNQDSAICHSGCTQFGGRSPRLIDAILDGREILTSIPWLMPVEPELFRRRLNLAEFQNRLINERSPCRAGSRRGGFLHTSSFKTSVSGVN